MGTTVAELVYACCQFYPKKNFIEDLIKLENKMDMSELAESIFSYSCKEDGYTCLLTLFDMVVGYHNRTDKYPDSSLPMFNEIESTAFYLIKMAEDNKLNMDKVLNCTADDGITLFWNAAIYSESLASELLKRNVVVTTVDYKFLIPSFQVS